MNQKLDEVLKQAREEAANKGPLPGVQAIITNLEATETAKLFQPHTPAVEPTKRVRVAVGGTVGGQDFLNADGIKNK